MPSQDSKPIRKVMISSTAHDLPEHRKQIVEACLRQNMFPLRMEDLPANSDEAAAASLKMVEEADVYIGVFANRYGYIPNANNPRQISVTEMEYDRAVEHRLERLNFVMDKSHPITVDDVDIENASKLKAFKDRVQGENIVRFFKSPDDLRAEAINSLSKLRKPDLTTFHYVSDIPAPPEAFIAHPYTLLQTHTLVGRHAELKLLTDWITGRTMPGDLPGDSIRIMNVVAIGGMGKSALTWKWFNEIAPEEMKSLAGRMWWSFYESDATFENFVIRSVAYMTMRNLDEVREIPAPERETQLIAALNREPFLLVLDGLERILIAYSRMDASRLDDSQVGKDKNLRKTADPRIGSFLKKLAQVKNSRILISSRLYPTELETDGGDPIPGTFRCDITGLTNEDAVELWRAFKITGSRDEVLPIFATFDKHPLLIQALAGEVKCFRRHPGNFEKWSKGNHSFNPAKFSKLHDAMVHVMKFALRGLDDKTRRVLNVISAFRMPTTFDTLTALLVAKSTIRFDLRTGKLVQEKGNFLAKESDLIAALTELEDRGLVGWDKRANRYDLHPIVRGVVWSGLGDDARRDVYSRLRSHFEALPHKDDYLGVSSLEELTPVIELYSTLIGLGRYDEAVGLFQQRLDAAMHLRLRTDLQRVELLEMLFPDGLDQLPRASKANDRGYILNALAQSYDSIGQTSRAVPLHDRASTIASEIKRGPNLNISLCNLSGGLLISGKLYESEVAAYRALALAREETNYTLETYSLGALGLTNTACGIKIESALTLQRALRIDIAKSARQYEGVDSLYLAQWTLRFGEFANALSLANRAWELAHVKNFEGDFIRAARVQGEAALEMNDLARADDRLHHALMRARGVNLILEELPALVALAELRRRKEELEAAREFLDDVWEAAERGPYPPIHADAFNVLAQIERDAGNTELAVEAATKAYRLAWCDGPPFAYHWGLEAAKKHLKELGAPEPEMPPFDESKFEPMPEVEIDPEDEFHVETLPGP